MAETLPCLLLPPDVAARIVALQRELACYEPLLPPHLTLLPPVRGRRAADRLAVCAERVAVRSPALTLTVGPSATFAPAAPVVYFQVGGAGLPWLHTWHRELTRAQAGQTEQTEEAPPFVPHVTLVYRLAPDVLRTCLTATSDVVWTVTIDAVHLVSIGGRAGSRRWRTRARIPLTGRAA